MTSLPEVIAAAEPIADGFRAVVPDNWLQGRTAYGGLSAALALHAAIEADADLPQLRSAQVAFIGPLAGEVTVKATLLRRGRNAAFVQADVTGANGLGLRATFVFMAPIASQLDQPAGEAPRFALPGPETKTYHGMATVPFTQNFEFVDQRDGLGAAEWLRWIRLREREGLNPAVELMAVADALPPAALKLIGGHAPLSSMTWQINLLDVPVTRDGWWLLRAVADHARSGNSSQRMQVWNADGVAVAEQVQSVAIFA
jgi:acyl-CoA thioesterase